MLIKKNLKLRFERIYFHLKGLGGSFFVPIVIVDILIPVLIYLSYLQNGVGYTLIIDIRTCTQMFIPMFSIWWVLFILREYVESDGNELLYVCKNKIKIFQLLDVFIIYLINVAILYVVISHIFTSTLLEYAKVTCICAFYFGITYFLIYLTKSLTLTLMADFLYTMVNIFGLELEEKFPLYCSYQDLDIEKFKNVYIPLAVTGVILMLIGVVLNKRIKKFC